MARTSPRAAEPAPESIQVSPEKFTELARSLQIGEAVLRAVADVESAGSGFIAESKPKILFEGHAFHRLTGGRFDIEHPDISYPKWNRKKYSGSSLGEWDRLEKACLLDRPAALQSASWGMFQIMGFNYGYCGMLDVEAFVAAQCKSADRQMELFARFISRERFLVPLRAINAAGTGNAARWAAFAEAYNGPLHAQNNYVGKLQAAHAKWLKRLPGAAEADAPAAAKTARRRAKTRVAIDAAITAEGRIDFQPLESTRRRMPRRRRNVRPDPVDLRDWQYQPNIAIAPAASMMPNNLRPVKDQGDTSACTGFALSTVIEYLLARTEDRPVEAISGHMLYDMARRYDEWAEPSNIIREEGQRRPQEEDLKDEGSSVRGALKGWSRQGASAEALWKKPDMPDATNEPDSDWWLDAVKRPMGAYYRIEPENIRDIHIALAEVGVVYASAFTHEGWDGLMDYPKNGPATDISKLPSIPEHPSVRDLGHAFAIVGYTERGFVIHNSWGADWGRSGLAILGYDDWIANAMDCWVVQLGVVTVEHQAVSQNAGLRADAKTGVVRLSRDVNLADHEISPYVINMENNGLLSKRGRFRTQPADVKLLVRHQMVAACKEWKIAANGVLDVAVYAHGGLTDEDAAAVAARYWIPHLYTKRLFPVFLMWETGALKTFNNILQDTMFGEDEKTAGGRWARMRERFDDWRNERLEGLARWPGSKLWGEMKQNADALSSGDVGKAITLDDRALEKVSGAVQLLAALKTAHGEGLLPNRVRLHLIGHSAGAIVHTYLAPRAIANALNVASISLMAPAVRLDVFKHHLEKLIPQEKIPLLVANLTDAAERADDTCKPYGHSLLYLVSRSFEDDEPTPILGMERHLVPALPTVEWGANVDQLSSPGGTWGAGNGVTRATSHGGMDNDEAIRDAIVSFIREGSRKDQREKELKRRQQRPG